MPLLSVAAAPCTFMHVGPRPQAVAGHDARHDHSSHDEQSKRHGTCRCIDPCCCAAVLPAPLEAVAALPPGLLPAAAPTFSQLVRSASFPFLLPYALPPPMLRSTAVPI